MVNDYDAANDLDDDGIGDGDNDDDRIKRHKAKLFAAL